MVEEGALPVEAGTGITETSESAESRPARADNSVIRQLREAHEAEKRRADDLARRVAELEPVGREVDDLRERTTHLERENLRRRVAYEEGVPSDAYEFVTGETEEALRPMARKLVGLLGRAPFQAGTNTQPPREQAPSVDEQIAGAYQAGNTALAIRLKRLRAGLPG